MPESKLRADVCGCFTPGQTPLVPHETLREHGKDIPISQEQETFMSIRYSTLRKKGCVYFRGLATEGTEILSLFSQNSVISVTKV
jgi:hypothetical protein